MRKATIVLLALLALGVGSCDTAREGKVGAFNVKWQTTEVGSVRVIQHIKTGECWVGLYETALVAASPAVCADVFGE